MAIADYRFSSPPRKEDLKQTATRRLMDQGLRPSSFRGSESESTGDVIRKWDAAVAAEAQAIKESRDPKRERERQLAQRTAGKAGADEALKKAGVTPEDFWTSEEGLTKTSFTERTGKKIDIPEEAQVGAMSREMETPEGGLVRQAVGPYGFASVKYTPEGAAKLAQQRATEEDRAIRYGTALAEAKKIGKQRELERGEEVAAKFAQWDADKRALEEGKQLQKQAGMRISRINRQLREAGRYRQKWEKASPTLSAEEYDALVQERGELQGLVGRRESLKEKGITDIGRQAGERRRQRGEQAAALARANMARIQAAEAEADAYKTQMSMANPYITQMQSYMAPMFPFLGQGGFGVSGTSIPFTLNPDLTLPPVAAEGEKKGKKNS